MFQPETWFFIDITLAVVNFILAVVNFIMFLASGNIFSLAVAAICAFGVFMPWTSWKK